MFLMHFGRFYLLLFAGFPKGCNTYDGPHSVACISSIWEMVGCLSQGASHPMQLSGADLSVLENQALP